MFEIPSLAQLIGEKANRVESKHSTQFEEDTLNELYRKDQRKECRFGVKRIKISKEKNK